MLRLIPGAGVIVLGIFTRRVSDGVSRGLVVGPGRQGSADTDWFFLDISCRGCFVGFISPDPAVVNSAEDHRRLTG